MAKVYQAYPEYKDSGVEWLGAIPAHWDIKRLGQLFEERREKVSDEDYPALSVTMQGIVPQLETAAKTDAGDNRKLVLKNDFVINSRSDRKGSSGISPYDGSVSLISIVMTPKRINPSFSHHLLRSYPFQEEFYRYGKGIVADLWSTNSSEMKTILLPEVPDKEAAQIAHFLDHETAKIDSLIEKQQQLIALLKEKRQAVISHAVTKGLNPKVKMKDSGVEWLGDVPEGWEVPQLTHKTKKIGDGLHATPFYSEDTGYFFINGNNLIDGSILLNVETKQVNREEYKKHYINLCQNTILISINGTIGNIALYKNEKVILGKSAAYITCPDELKAEYLMFFLKSSEAHKYFNLEVTGTTIFNLSLNSIRKMHFPLPSIAEQKAIANYCNNINNKFDQLIKKSESFVFLIQERRAALISAAVTGKIDLRDWQAT